MQTPWGRPADLDMTDRDLAYEILSFDKHQILEGLVFENTFDQILQPLTETQPPELRRLDIETVVVDARRRTGKWLALVWMRTPTEGLGRYLLALERVALVHLVEFRDGGFFATECSGGRRAGPPVPLWTLMGDVSGTTHTFPEIDRKVRDANRQRTAFWGYLSDTYSGDRLWKEVVLFRLFINFGVQPFFRGVWNLDRICLCGDQLWMLEVKHKYPFGRPALQFGINDGELKMMRLVAGAGIASAYALIVKPRWSRDIGSMYLHNNLEMRDRAAVIGKVMDADAIAAAARTTGGRSPAHTSFTGTGSLAYKTIPAEAFSLLGSFAEGSGRLAGSLLRLLQREALPSVQDEALRRLSESG